MNFVEHWATKEPDDSLWCRWWRTRTKLKLQTVWPQCVKPCLQLNTDSTISSLSSGRWRRFYVHLAGDTNGTHKEFVSHIRQLGHTKVSSPEESDYVVVFCPIASQAETDFSEALEDIPCRSWLWPLFDQCRTAKSQVSLYRINLPLFLYRFWLSLQYFFPRLLKVK